MVLWHRKCGIELLRSKAVPASRRARIHAGEPRLGPPASRRWPCMGSGNAGERFSDEGYKHNEVIEPGFKYTTMDLQAGLGLQQLGRVEKTSATP